jgi:hypothetical protein
MTTILSQTYYGEFSFVFPLKKQKSETNANIAHEIEYLKDGK